jgi:hypothetical protein
LASYRSQRRLQRHLERCGRGGRDRLGGWGGERVADEFDRLAREHGQPRREARMLKRLRGAPQLVQIVLGHIRQGQLRGANVSVSKSRRTTFFGTLEKRLNRCM